MNNHPLASVKDDLQRTVSSLCVTLRRKVFDELEDINAKLSLVESQMLADELSLIISHHQTVETALQSYLTGKIYTESFERQVSESIYEFCLYYFEKVECPLGSATQRLDRWMKGKSLSSGLTKNAKIEAVATSLTVPRQQIIPRLVTAANRYRRQSDKKDHILAEYNDRMLHVHTLLLAEQPVNYILMIMRLNQSLT